MNGGSDLVARLLIQGDAKGAVAAAGEARAAVEQLKAAANDTGPAVDKAARSTDALARELVQLGGAAPAAASGVKSVAQAQAQLAAEEARLAATRAGGAVAAEASVANTAKMAAASGLGQAALRGFGSAIAGVTAGLVGGLVPLAVTAGVALLTELLTAGARQQEEYTAGQKAFGDAMADCADVLRDAHANLRDWGGETTALKSPTDDLGASTRVLANETFRLADARRQAAVEKVAEAKATIDAEILALEKRRSAPLNFAEALAVGGFAGITPEQIKASRTAQTPVGVTADGSPLFAERTIDEALKKLRDQSVQLLSRGIAVTFAPDKAKPAKTPRATAAAADRQELRAEGSARDLAADVAAQESLRAALLAGGEALDAWKIKEAGRQAVEKQGLADRPKLTAAEQALIVQIRGRAEETERLKVANERVEKAIGLQKTSELDAAALQRRSVAAVAGEQAMEDLRVAEAGLQRQRELGLDTLDQLLPRYRAYAEGAIRAAKAKEQQAIATEKAEKVAGTLRDLDKRIAQETAHATAIAGGTRAELDYAQAVMARQEVEKAGSLLTAEQVAQIEAKTSAYIKAAAAADLAQLDKLAEAELKAVGLTRREREIEARVLERRKLLLEAGLAATEEEADARARILELTQASNVEAARAISDLRDDLRRAFIESGRLGFDEVGDYVERRLREAVYRALLEKPIDILINAVVNGVGGIASQIGGMSGGGNALAGLLGLGAPGGGTIAGTLGNAGIGALAANAVGVRGSGNGLVDAGASIAGSLAGTALASSMGAATGSLALAAAGPIGAAVGLALAAFGSGLFKNEKRPYARTDIGVAGGQFALRGSTSEDGADTSETSKLAQGVADALNAAAGAFGLDVTKLDASFQSAIGYVEGKNTAALGQGYFGGAGGSYREGAAITNMSDPAALAEAVIKETLLRAIDSGAAQFTAAERKIVEAAGNLDQAAATINASRNLSKTLDDAILQLTDPAAFERKKALDAVEESYQALKTQAQELVSAGLVSADVLAKIDELHDLQVTDALERLGDAADSAASKLKAATDFAGGIDDRLLQLTDPDAWRVQQINRDADAMRDEAAPMVAAGLVSADILDKIEQLRALNIADAFGQLASAVGGATAAFSQARPALQRWLDQMGGLSELNPAERLQAAQASYERMLERARAADPEALSQITGLGDQLIDADRAATSSAAARAARAAKIRSDIAGLAGMSSADAAATPIKGKVEIANLPAMQVMYTTIAEVQTSSLKASFEKLEKGLAPKLDLTNTNLDELGVQLVDGFGAMAAALANGLAGVVTEVAAQRQAAEVTNQQLLGRA